MIYVLDTHPLVWHLEGNPRLSPAAATVLAASETSLVIPSIVLAEVWHLYHRKRIRTSPDDVRSKVLTAANCAIYPLDEAVLDLFPTNLDIHDAIIVATARLYRDILKQPVRLITCDREIINSRYIETLW
jgi:predicted nucleic acid-binding protein